MRRCGPLTVSDIVCRRTTEVLRRTLAEANSGLKCTAGIEVVESAWVRHFPQISSSVSAYFAMYWLGSVIVLFCF